MRTKTVEYSYPTSPNAERFGFGNEGCWTVEYNYVSKLPEPIKAFERIEDAVEYVLGLPEPWSLAFLRYGTERIPHEQLEAVCFQAKYAI